MGEVTSKIKPSVYNSILKVWFPTTYSVSREVCSLQARGFLMRVTKDTFSWMIKKKKHKMLIYLYIFQDLGKVKRQLAYLLEIGTCQESPPGTPSGLYQSFFSIYKKKEQYLCKPEELYNLLKTLKLLPLWIAVLLPSSVTINEKNACQP